MAWPASFALLSIERLLCAWAGRVRLSRAFAPPHVTVLPRYCAPGDTSITLALSAIRGERAAQPLRTLACLGSRSGRLRCDYAAGAPRPAVLRHDSWTDCAA